MWVWLIVYEARGLKYAHASKVHRSDEEALESWRRYMEIFPKCNLILYAGILLCKENYDNDGDDEEE